MWEQIWDLNKSRGIRLFCDIHGHSRKKNVFFYGCSPRLATIAPEEGVGRDHVMPRLLPYILWKLGNGQGQPVADPAATAPPPSSTALDDGLPPVVNVCECVGEVPNAMAEGLGGFRDGRKGQLISMPQLSPVMAGGKTHSRFVGGANGPKGLGVVGAGGEATARNNACLFYSFKDSSFRVQRSKRGTARVVVWSQYHIDDVFTLEASFCGPGDNAADTKARAEWEAAYAGKDTTNAGSKVISGGGKSNGLTLPRCRDATPDGASDGRRPNQGARWGGNSGATKSGGAGGAGGTGGAGGVGGAGDGEAVRRVDLDFHYRTEDLWELGRLFCIGLHDQQGLVARDGGAPPWASDDVEGVAERRQ